MKKNEKVDREEFREMYEDRYQILPDPNRPQFFYIKPKAGERPKCMKGLFTSPRYAKDAIDQYIAQRPQ